MADLIDSKARLRAIRRLASPVPSKTCGERLEKIVKIATGELDPIMGRVVVSPTMIERLRQGQASRSPRIGDAPKEKKKEEPEDETKRRRARATKDRKERGGQDRSESEDEE